MKNFKDTIQKIKENPKGKALLFFGFYLVFFVIIILFVRTSSRYKTSSSDYEKGSSLTGQIRYLQLENYHYSYHIERDGLVFDFQGNKMDKEESFTYLNESYYCNDTVCKVKKDTWEEVSNPNIYSVYLDAYKLATLLDQSMLDSRTTYESGKLNYNYLVSVDHMNQIFLGENTDLDLEADSISLLSDENQQLSSIIFQLDSYGKYHHLCEREFKIHFTISKIGEITEIERPS